MISYIIPTHNRVERLRATLNAISALGPHDSTGGAEVIVVDNGSREVPILPRRLPSGIPLTFIRLAANRGAAARNEGVKASDPGSQWVVMLDDDSYPDDNGFAGSLSDQPADVGAVSADIWLPSTHGADVRESGGLPEVFIGCGVAIRRSLFLELGGYDPSFHYYVEEYDLAARMLLAGYRVAFDLNFSIAHAKDQRNRDMNLILARLIRNNGWVARRYAPKAVRAAELRSLRSRYRQIAIKEHAVAGYRRGLLELRSTIRAQPSREMSTQIWDRFTGLAAAREALAAAQSLLRFRTAAVVDHGKNAWVIAAALDELGVRIVGEHDDAEALVIGTMSPGPMMDAFSRRAAPRRHGISRPVVMPWLMPATQPVGALSEARAA